MTRFSLSKFLLRLIAFCLCFAALTEGSASAQAVYSGAASGAAASAQPSVLATTRNIYPEGIVGSTPAGGATSATYRIYQVVPYGVSGLQFVYTNEVPGNFGANLTGQTSPITVRVGVEIGSNLYPLTWSGGNSSVVIAAGQNATSDVLPVIVAAGTKIHVRSYVAGASAGQWGGASTSNPFNGDDSDMIATGTDLSTARSTAGGFGNGFSTNNNSGWFGPVACLGTPTASGLRRTFIGFGDSIFKGAIDAGPGNNAANMFFGWFQKGIADQYPYIQCGVSGDAAANWVINGNLRKLLGTLSGAKYAVVAYGANDVDISGSTATVLEANLQTMYTTLSASGFRVVACTITPKTDSSNVAVAASNNVRLPVNVWQRSAAPTGVYYKFDIEPTVSTVGSGVWSSPSLLADGNHPANAGHVLIGTAWGTVISSFLPAY